MTHQTLAEIALDIMEAARLHTKATMHAEPGNDCVRVFIVGKTGGEPALHEYGRVEFDEVSARWVGPQGCNWILDSF